MVLPAMLGLSMPTKDRPKELRAAAGLTPLALAGRARLCISAVAWIESGKTPDPRVGAMAAGDAFEGRQRGGDDRGARRGGPRKRWKTAGLRARPTAGRRLGAGEGPPPGRARDG